MFPVQFMARMMDAPLSRDTTPRPVSGLVPVQAVLNATERDQTTPRPTFEHLALGQTLTGLVKSLSKGLALVEIDGQTVAMRLPPKRRRAIRYACASPATCRNPYFCSPPRKLPPATPRS